MTTQEISEQLSEHVADAIARVAITRQVLTPKEHGDLTAEALTAFLERKRIILVQLPDPQPGREPGTNMYGDFTVRRYDGRVLFRDNAMPQDLESLQWQAQTRLAAVQESQWRISHLEE